MTPYQIYREELLNELIISYPGLKEYKDSIEKLKTDTPLGKNLYTHFLNELLEYGKNFRMRRVGTSNAIKENDFASLAVYNFNLEVPGRDGDTYKWSMVDNYPINGHEFFMTKMDDIIKELNITVAPDIEFERDGKKFRCLNFKLCVKSSNEEHVNILFSEKEEFLIDIIKEDLINNKIKELCCIDSKIDNDLLTINYKAIKCY